MSEDLFNAEQAEASIGFRGVAYLRGFARALIAYFDTDFSRLNPREQERRHEAARTGAERVLESIEPPTDVETIAALALGAPGVVRGFVQQTLSLDEENVVRVPGGAGAWIHGHFYRARFRVFIHSGKAFAEATDTDLSAAVREAFTRAGVPMPKGLVPS